MRRVSLLLIVLEFVVAVPASAQTTDTTESTTPGETVTAPAEPSTDAAEPSGEDNRVLAAFVLVFSGSMVGGLLYYLWKIQKRHYDTIDRVVAAGYGVPTVVSIGSLVPGEDALASGDEAEEEVTIDGPAVVWVGKPSEFRAKRGAQEVSAAWTTAPADPSAGATATLDPSQGATTKLTAQTAGTLKLTASVDGATAEATVPAVAAPSETSTSGLAFVGEGFGTLVIAIVVLGVATVLGLLDVLDSSALAGLFGAVVGYIFVKGAVTAQSGGGSGDKAAPQ